MSREQFDQRLIEELEHELRDALAIEPSPDFARQVRARIAARPAPVAWWKFALPIAATCVLAVGLVTWLRPAAVQYGTPITQNPSRDIPLMPETVTATVAPETSTPTPRITPVRIEPTPAPAPEPEIIVPPDRALALARLLELTRNGSLNEETLKPVAAARPPAELEIKPLVVAPILIAELETPSGAAQGGADRE